MGSPRGLSRRSRDALDRGEITLGSSSVGISSVRGVDAQTAQRCAREAVADARAGLALAQRLGAAAHCDRIVALLRQLGVTSVPRPDGAQRSASAGLTSRETQVLELGSATVTRTPRSVPGCTSRPRRSSTT